MKNFSRRRLRCFKEEGFLGDEKSFVLNDKEEEHNLKAVIQNHVLIDMPNVIITPHNAFNTQKRSKEFWTRTLRISKVLLRREKRNIRCR